MTTWHDGLTEADARADGVVEVFSEVGLFIGQAIWREETDRWWFASGAVRGRRSTAAQSAAAIKAACSREERERR